MPYLLLIVEPPGQRLVDGPFTEAKERFRALQAQR